MFGAVGDSSICIMVMKTAVEVITSVCEGCFLSGDTYDICNMPTKDVHFGSLKVQISSMHV